jgi:phage gpG-like protein
MDDFIRKIKNLQNYINNDVKDDIGITAVQHYKKAFHDEAFSDKSEKDMPWQEVKRRKNGKGAAAKRKILTGETGELAEATYYSKDSSGVDITNPKIYAPVHNEGLNAGRGKGFKMPKRQFIGKSVLMMRKITTKIESRMLKIMT